MSETDEGEPHPPVPPLGEEGSATATTGPATAPAAAPRTSRIAGLKATAKDRVTDVQARLETTRGKVPAVDAAFKLQERDRRLAGNLLASALAYRLFLWLLPVLLVLVAALGFLRDAGTDNPADAARKLGLSAYVASSVADASEQAQRSRWVLVVIGLVALFSASTSGVKALRAVHTLAWNLPPAKPKSMLASAGGFVLFALGAIAVTVVAAWLRDSAPGTGVTVTFLIFTMYGALWLVASLRLPHADCPWTALLPGTILASVGTQVLHLVSVYYLADKLQNSSELYGALGSAAAVLLWLFFIGRLIVASALLNATLWERRQAREQASGSTSAPTTPL